MTINLDAAFEANVTEWVRTLGLGYTDPTMMSGNKDVAVLIYTAPNVVDLTVVVSSLELSLNSEPEQMKALATVKGQKGLKKLMHGYRNACDALENISASVKAVA